MTLYKLKKFLIEVINHPGPEQAPLACRILADIVFHEMHLATELTDQQLKYLKHQLKVALARHGSATNQLNMNDLKVESSVHQFIRNGQLSTYTPETFTFY